MSHECSISYVSIFKKLHNLRKYRRTSKNELHTLCIHGKTIIIRMAIFPKLIYNNIPRKLKKGTK